MNHFFLTATWLSLVLMTALVNAQTQENAPADMKITDEQCVTIWKAAHTSSGASPQVEDISLEGAKAYVKDLTKADSDGNGKLSTKEWADACKSGLVMTKPAVPAEAPRAP